MGIWDRLGNVINSYISDMAGEKTWGKPSDPDLDAAYDELNDYLNRKETGYAKKEQEKEPRRDSKSKNPPEELRDDFALLGVTFTADAEECKAAYKKLLKIHHPDRHAGHEGNYQKATRRTAQINAAYDRIEKWRESESGKNA